MPAAWWPLPVEERRRLNVSHAPACHLQEEMGRRGTFLPLPALGRRRRRNLLPAERRGEAEMIARDDCLPRPPSLFL